VAPDEGSEAAVIDPGGDAELILSQLRYRELTPRRILLTHGHIDHVEAVAALKTAFPDAELCIHEEDAAMVTDPAACLASWIGLAYEPCEPDRLLTDGDSVALGSQAFEVIHTPGHTRGGICFLVRQADAPDIVFSGDTLFAGGIGRTDFPGGDFQQLLESTRQRLFALPDDTVVYPGHGEATTIGEERRTNPFLQ
jgi:glyoxylase-like metal-dependent hydrolase (beta-lactamase superfamily II)